MVGAAAVAVAAMKARSNASEGGHVETTLAKVATAAAADPLDLGRVLHHRAAVLGIAAPPISPESADSYLLVRCMRVGAGAPRIVSPLLLRAFGVSRLSRYSTGTEQSLAKSVLAG